MQTYIISYDMVEGGDYDALYKVIKSYGTWARITDSTWAVVTKDNAEKVRDHLSAYLPQKSSALFVFVSFRRWQSPALGTTVGGFLF